MKSYAAPRILELLSAFETFAACFRNHTETAVKVISRHNCVIVVLRRKERFKVGNAQTANHRLEARDVQSAKDQIKVAQSANHRRKAEVAQSANYRHKAGDAQTANYRIEAGAVRTDEHRRKTEDAQSANYRLKAGDARTVNHRIEAAAAQTDSHRLKDVDVQPTNYRLKAGDARTANHRIEAGAAQTDNHRLKGDGAQSTNSFLFGSVPSARQNVIRFTVKSSTLALLDTCMTEILRKIKLFCQQQNARSSKSTSKRLCDAFCHRCSCGKFRGRRRRSLGVVSSQRAGGVSRIDRSDASRLQSLTKTVTSSRKVLCGSDGSNLLVACRLSASCRTVTRPRKVLCGSGYSKLLARRRSTSSRTVTRHRKVLCVSDYSKLLACRRSTSSRTVTRPRKVLCDSGCSNPLAFGLSSSSGTVTRPREVGCGSHGSNPLDSWRLSSPRTSSIPRKVCGSDGSGLLDSGLRNSPRPLTRPRKVGFGSDGSGLLDSRLQHSPKALTRKVLCGLPMNNTHRRLRNQRGIFNKVRSTPVPRLDLRPLKVVHGLSVNECQRTTQRQEGVSQKVTSSAGPTRNEAAVIADVSQAWMNQRMGNRMGRRQRFSCGHGQGLLGQNFTRLDTETSSTLADIRVPSLASHPPDENTGSNEFPRKDVYIAHCERDLNSAATARTLLDTLESRGLSCILGDRDILPGEVISEAIINAVTSSRYVVFLLSKKNSLCTGWCSFVLNASLWKMVESNRVLLIPLLLDIQETEVPQSLRNLTTINMMTDPNYQEKLFTVLRGPEVTVMDLMPAGNVSHGLVWSYYLNYLKDILPGIVSRIDRFCSNNHSGQCLDVRMPRKFYILVPASCFCPRGLDLADCSRHISFGGHLDDVIGDRAGCKNRVYRHTVWNISRPGKQTFQFVGEYATVVHTLYQMECVRQAGMDTGQRQKQTISFVRSLQAILDKNGHHQAEIIFFNDTDKDGNRVLLSDVLSPRIEASRVTSLRT